MASTGKTHGIRFRINPPSTANSSACSREISSAPTAFASEVVAAGANAGSSLAERSNACLMLPSAVFSVSTSVPASSAGSAVLASPFFRGMRMPSAVTVAFCLAMVATGPHSAGKK